jgi:hypothetical protein
MPRWDTIITPQTGNDAQNSSCKCKEDEQQQQQQRKDIPTVTQMGSPRAYLTDCKYTGQLVTLEGLS